MAQDASIHSIFHFYTRTLLTVQNNFVLRSRKLTSKGEGGVVQCKAKVNLHLAENNRILFTSQRLCAGNTFVERPAMAIIQTMHSLVIRNAHEQSVNYTVQNFTCLVKGILQHYSTRCLILQRTCNYHGQEFSFHAQHFPALRQPLSMINMDV